MQMQRMEQGQGCESRLGKVKYCDCKVWYCVVGLADGATNAARHHAMMIEDGRNASPAAQLQHAIRT